MKRFNLLNPVRRRWRKAGGAAVVLTLVAGPVVAGCAVRTQPAEPLDSPDIAASDWTRKYPPVPGGITTIDHRFPAWKTVAWLSTKEAFCVATVHKPYRGGPQVTCGPAPTVLSADGPAALTSKPLPQVGPMDPGSDERLFIGTARGAVTTVEVTVFGTTVTSPVTRLPTADQRLASAYAIWLPTVGRGGFDWSDITAVVARNAAGDVVARIT